VPGPRFVCAPRDRQRPLRHPPYSPRDQNSYQSISCSRLARERRLNLVTTILNQRDGHAYNTAVLFDRQGQLVGTYDKVHPAPGEPVTAGDSFPVFSIEGVRVGMQICFDLGFPEGARALGVQGADIIFWPTMWIGPTAHYIDCIMRARAMENFCYLVASAYIHFGDGSSPSRNSLGPTAVVGWDGCILAQTGTRPGLAVATVDCDEPRRLQTGRTEHFAARRPIAYGSLTALTGEKHAQVPCR
jgi:predicted amidohydrolase